MSTPLRVGISECLLGRAVRYDGGHEHARFLVETLGPRVEWIPVCPEVGAGFGVPRPPMDLVASPSGTRLVDRSIGEDSTEPLENWTTTALDGLADVDGFVLKADSPSCGLEGVRLYRDLAGDPVRDGMGLFAAALTARYPMLPVAEAEDLGDPARCEEFLKRMEEHSRVRESGEVGGIG